MSYKKLIFSILVVSSFLLNCSKVKVGSSQERFIGVKIYEYQGDFNDLFKIWKEIGINTVFSSVELLSNNQFKQLAKQYQIKTFVILPIFYAPEETAKDSTVYAITNEGKFAEDDWVKFACPSHKELGNRVLILFVSLLKHIIRMLLV